MKNQPKPLPITKEILEEHVTLTIECLDRLYLNDYVPALQTEAGLIRFLVQHLKFPVASPAVLGQITQGYVRRVEAYIQKHQIPVVRFQKWVRNDLIACKLRREYPVQDGVVFVGVAEEKAQAFKGSKGKPTQRGYVQFQYTRQPVFVKHYYFYVRGAQFGEGFIKVCTYAPYGIKVYLNGHEWAKRQLERAGVTYEALDNGFWRCADPARW
jgi:hypothetical protein